MTPEEKDKAYDGMLEALIYLRDWMRSIMAGKELALNDKYRKVDNAIKKASPPTENNSGQK
jgi:hypothetical protein